MISLNINLKRNISFFFFFFNKQLVTDVCILLGETYEYKKLANFITLVISAMKFTISPLGWLREINFLGCYSWL